MQSSRLHFAAMTMFVMGFVLASSGWAPIIALGLQHRPDYSVCGQDMCACLPTTTIEPECPLCLIKDDESVGCANESQPTDNPKRLPRTERFDSISDASQAGCASIFLSLVLGTLKPAALVATDSEVIRPMADHPPPPRYLNIQSPPPRA